MHEVTMRGSWVEFDVPDPAEIRSSLKELGGWHSPYSNTCFVPQDQLPKAKDLFFERFGSDGTRSDQVDLTIWLNPGVEVESERETRFACVELCRRIIVMSGKFGARPGEGIEFPCGQIYQHKDGSGKFVGYRAPKDGYGVIVIRRMSRRSVDDIMTRIAHGHPGPFGSFVARLSIDDPAKEMPELPPGRPLRRSKIREVLRTILRKFEKLRALIERDHSSARL
jgi:hypothetical protein